MSSTTGESAFDQQLDLAMRQAIAEGGPASELRMMIDYHMGWANRDGSPLPRKSGDQGKRIRPRLAILAGEAAGGSLEQTLPLAAAIELLHNFTLVHDDIQDRSDLRRHRPTVWSLWGEAQAINTGDALFAAAHLSLYNLEGSQTLEIARMFDRTTMEIVTGQTLDLGFENAETVSSEQYLEMIGGKTASILGFAAAAGAMAAGANSQQVNGWRDFGIDLGLGFQIRDDYLGIWGATSETGKREADDLRRRKRSLPVVLLQEAADARDRQEIDLVLGSHQVSEQMVQRLLNLLDQYQIEQRVAERSRHYHDEALARLNEVVSPELAAAKSLRELVEQLAVRSV